jgi:hypothetical protein
MEQFVLGIFQEHLAKVSFFWISKSHERTFSHGILSSNVSYYAHFSLLSGSVKNKSMLIS